MERGYFIRYILVPAASAAVTVLVLSGALFLWIKYHPEQTTGLFDAWFVSERGAAAEPRLYSFETVVVDAVERANPAVVAITISKNVPVYERYFESVPGPFGDFFGFSIPRLRQNGTQEEEIGGGSGFLVSEDGYIVTNRHVVEDENAEYTIFLNDGTKYDTQVIARDPALDVAILKIDGSGFRYLPFGDSSSLKVGQSVIAIGNALAEFRNTVSLGIVSGLSRSIVASDREGNPESLDELIQTDAAINQGNSGGPLLNLAGEVVGMNVAVASGAENIGFAVSGDSVKAVVDSVQQHGRIVRPFLGVRYLPITEDIAERNDLPVDYGVLVERGPEADDLAVIPDSPADKAGLLEGDVILEVDGTEITEDHSLSSLIRNRNVGESVELTILRNGEEMTARVTLEEMP